MNSSLLGATVHGSISLTATIEAIGWTLLHSVWQAAAAALALWCFLTLARRASPVVRYAVGCAALSLMCLSVVSTFVWQIAISDGSPTKRLPRAARDMAVEPSRDAHRAAEPAAILLARFIPSATETEMLVAPLHRWLLWVVGLWAIGVGFLSIRLAVGWRAICQMRAGGFAPRDPAWSERFARLRERLGVSSPVRLLCSSSCSVPMVIGWGKPVVVVPAGLLTGLSVSQLEALFAHELAHIRRHDYLVNFLQNVVETLLFYHPAVWWISGQIRTEREHCCDDIALSTCGGALDYARALTALAEYRHTPAALGLAATGGSLVGRIRRLAGVDQPRPRGGSSVAALLLVACAATSFFLAAGSSHSDEPRDAATPKSATPKPETVRVRGGLLDPKVPRSSKLAGNEVVATVNGQPILASEIFERAYPEPMPPEGLSLLVASKNIANGRVSEQELRALQEVAIKKYLKDYIRTRILAQAIEAKLEKEQKDKIEEAIGKMFDEYVVRLKKDLKAATRQEVEKKLHEQGTSLASLKVEFRYRLLADEYLRSKWKALQITRNAIEAYYQQHRDDFGVPAESFTEVEPSIRQKLMEQLQHKTLEDLYRQAVIESPYLSDRKIEPMNDSSASPVKRAGRKKAMAKPS